MRQDAVRRGSGLVAQVLERSLPSTTSVATFASETPVAFETNGTVRDALKLASTPDPLVLERELQVDQPPHAERRASVAVMRSISSSSSSDSVAGGI